MDRSLRRKKILQTVSLVGIVLALAIFMLFYRPVSLGGDTHYFVVFTGSMQSTIPVGSVIVVKSVDANTLKEGDIICFKTLQQSVTHRIVKITYNGLITKGDANEDPDPFVVEKKGVIGKVIFIIPYLGYLSYFVKTPLGFTLLIILPAAIVVTQEIRNIINHRKTTNQQEDKITSPTRREN